MILDTPDFLKFGGSEPAGEPVGKNLRKPTLSEQSYLLRNPKVAGMATEDSKVVFNPYFQAIANPAQKQSLYAIESARNAMKTDDTWKQVQVTDEQKGFLTSLYGQQFAPSTNYYADNPDLAKQTVLSRIVGGDTMGNASYTNEQKALASKLVSKMYGGEDAQQPQSGTIKTSNVPVEALGMSSGLGRLNAGENFVKGLFNEVPAAPKKISELVEPNTRDWFRFSESGIPLEHGLQNLDLLKDKIAESDIPAYIRAHNERKFPQSYGKLNTYIGNNAPRGMHIPGAEQFITDGLEVKTTPLDLDFVNADIRNYMKGKGKFTYKNNPNITLEELADFVFKDKPEHKRLQEYMHAVVENNPGLNYSYLNSDVKNYIEDELRRYIADSNIYYSTTEPQGNYQAQTDLVKKLISQEGVESLWGFKPSLDHAYRVVRKYAPVEQDLGTFDVGNPIDPSWQDFENYGVVRGTQYFGQDAYSNKRNPLPNYWADYENPAEANYFRFGRGIEGINEGQKAVNAGSSVYEFNIEQLKRNPAYRVVQDHDNVGKALERYLVLNQRKGSESLVSPELTENLRSYAAHNGIELQGSGPFDEPNFSIEGLNSHPIGPGQGTLSENMDRARRQIIEREAPRINQSRLSGADVSKYKEEMISEHESFKKFNQEAKLELQSLRDEKEKVYAELENIKKKRLGIYYDNIDLINSKDSRLLEAINSGNIADVFNANERNILNIYGQRVKRETSLIEKLFEVEEDITRASDRLASSNQELRRSASAIETIDETLSSFGKSGHSSTGLLLDKALPSARDGIRHRTQIMPENLTSQKNLKGATNRTGIMLPDAPAVEGYGTRFDEVQFPENRPQWQITYDKITPFEHRPMGVHLANLKTDAKVLKNYLPLIKESLASDLRVARAAPGTILPMARDAAGWSARALDTAARSGVTTTARTLLEVADRATPYLVAAEAPQRAADIMMDAQRRGEVHPNKEFEVPEALAYGFEDAAINFATIGQSDFYKWYLKASEKEKDEYQKKLIGALSDSQPW